MDVFAPLDGPPCQSITVDFSDQGPETLEIISLAMEVFDRVVKHSKPCFDQRAADPECMIQARPTIVFVQANRLELFYTVMRRMFSEQCILVTYCPERRGEELGIDPGLCFQSSRQFMMRLRLNVRRFQRDHAVSHFRSYGGMPS